MGGVADDEIGWRAKEHERACDRFEVGRVAASDTAAALLWCHCGRYMGQSAGDGGEWLKCGTIELRWLERGPSMWGNVEGYRL